MHLIWKSDTGDERAYTRASIDNIAVLRGVAVTACQPLAGRIPTLRIGITSDWPPADYFAAGPLMLVSQRLKQLLAAHAVAAEFLPVELHRHGKSLDFGAWYVFNLLGKVDCLDVLRARFQMDGEFVDRIELLALDSTKTAGHPVLRLARCFDVITAVDDALARAIREAGMTGMKLIDAADWRW